MAQISILLVVCMHLLEQLQQTLQKSYDNYMYDSTCTHREKLTHMLCITQHIAISHRMQEIHIFVDLEVELFAKWSMCVLFTK